MNYNNAFNDMFKNMLDYNQLFSTHRRNFEAFAAVNQTMVESAQAMSRRNAEVARDSFEHMFKASKEMFSGGTPEASLSKQADFTKSMFENALSNMREMTEMMTKSGFEAFDVLNKRTAESMEEISRASSTAKKK